MLTPGVQSEPGKGTIRKSGQELISLAGGGCLSVHVFMPPSAANSESFCKNNKY